MSESGPGSADDALPRQPRPNPLGANAMRGRVVRQGETPASAGNIANIITVARILLTPVFVWLLLADAGADGPMRWIAAAAFIILISTDSVDGFLARRNNLVTNLGKLLDPIADKGLTGSAVVGLSILGELPWWVTAIILVREVGITVYRFIALSDRVIPADWLGKVKTVVQAIAISFALAPLWSLLGSWIHVANTVLMTAAVVLTVVSGASYLWQAWKARPRAS